jgi:hypothetical protein
MPVECHYEAATTFEAYPSRAPPTIMSVTHASRRRVLFRIASSHIGRLALILLLAPTIAGCSTTQRVPFNLGALKKATGVTTRSGSEIAFEGGGASFSADTI